LHYADSHLKQITENTLEKVLRIHRNGTGGEQLWNAAAISC